MSKNYAGEHWRQTIYTKLRARNKTENEYIKELIQTYNRLFDNSESLRYETKQLSFQNEKLREELIRCQEASTNPVASSPSLMLSSSTASSQNIQQSNTNEYGGLASFPSNVSYLLHSLILGGFESPTSGRRIKTAGHYEQKVYKLQEELTDLHRNRSENAQQLVELNQCLQERDRLLVSVQNTLAERETELLFAKEEQVSLEMKLQELEATNQLLRDEYQAMNLICNALEEKNKTLQEESQELIQRWMALKAKDAERLNDENEAAIRKKQEIVEKNLKEACLEPRLVIEEDKFATISPICISSTLPSKSYLSFDAHEGEVNALVFSSLGRLLASGGSDRRIKLWDISHGTADNKGTLTGSNAGVNAIDFDLEESLILGASNDFACRVWTICDQRLRHTLTGHSGKVMACKFLFESSKVVTGSHDRTLKLWDLRSRSCTKTFFPGSSCNDVAISDAQSSTVISGHFDKTVKFWDIRSEDKVNEINMQGKVTSLSLSQSGYYLLCSVRDDALRIVDLRENKISHTFTQEMFHIGADYSRAVFSPDGAYVACGCNSGALYIWSVDTGQVVKELREHSSCVLAAAWHPKGRIIATCDRSKKILAWGDF